MFTEIPTRILIGIVGAIALALIAFVGINALRGDAVADHKVEVQAKTSDARETAAEQRVEDAVTNTRSEEELNAVIAAAPKGTELSAPARALACERLRRIGRIPPACRHPEHGGTETAPD